MPSAPRAALAVLLLGLALGAPAVVLAAPAREDPPAAVEVAPDDDAVDGGAEDAPDAVSDDAPDAADDAGPSPATGSSSCRSSSTRGAARRSARRDGGSA